MINNKKTEFRGKALRELTRRREVRELQFKLFGLNLLSSTNQKKHEQQTLFLS